MLHFQTLRQQGPNERFPRRSFSRRGRRNPSRATRFQLRESAAGDTRHSWRTMSPATTHLNGELLASTKWQRFSSSSLKFATSAKGGLGRSKGRSSGKPRASKKA